MHGVVIHPKNYLMTEEDIKIDSNKTTEEMIEDATVEVPEVLEDEVSNHSRNE